MPEETVSSFEKQLLTDPEQISKAAMALELIVEKDWAGSQKQQLPIRLLRAFCRLAHDNNNEPNRWFTPIEIVEAMVALGAPWKNLDDENARLRVNDHWNKLMELWELRKMDLQQRLDGDGLFFEPQLEKLPGGGAGNKVYYRLQFFTHSPQSAATVSGPKLTSSEPKGQRVDVNEVNDTPDKAGGKTQPLFATRGIRYYSVPIELPRPLRWIPTEGLKTGGAIDQSITRWTLQLIKLLLLVIIMTVVVLPQVPTVKEFLTKGLGILMILSLLWFVLSWLLILIRNRVVRAPIWWQTSLFYGDNVIELRFDPSDDAFVVEQPPIWWKNMYPVSSRISVLKEPIDGRFPRLHLIRYVADCPICGVEGAGRSSIRLGSSGKEFFGRIIGKCRHAPQEHVWSFDHITREGRFLR